MENLNRFAALLWLPLFAFSYWRAPKVPPDFAIKISGMFYDEVNTFNETYSRSGIKRTAKNQMSEGELVDIISIGDSTVSLKLTTQEKREIYLNLDNISYAYYPENISTGCENQIVPSHKVTLTIRANNVVKYISYEDGCEDNTKQNKEIRHFINSLYEISQRHKAVRQLPETMMFDM